MPDKVLLKSYPMQFEAGVAKAKLDSQGIPCWILDKQDSSYLTFGNIELYVLAPDKEKALALISLEEE